MTISAWLCADLMLPANTTTQNFRHSLSSSGGHAVCDAADMHRLVWKRVGQLKNVRVVSEKNHLDVVAEFQQGMQRSSCAVIIGRLQNVITDER